MQQKRVSVQWGVNDELDQWRTTLASPYLPLTHLQADADLDFRDGASPGKSTHVPFTTCVAYDLQSKAARDLLESGAVPAEFCPEINVVSFPQIGYLVVCRPYAEQQPPEGWTYAVSQSFMFSRYPSGANANSSPPAITRITRRARC